MYILQKITIKKIFKNPLDSFITSNIDETRPSQEEKEAAF